ncbi:hypothetical protein [Vibrio phage VpKK5]|uniref:hypothetical protein n=1 Tax=Vibrio phage VpKK5 TaxID=1538804 RepID=UPI0004F7F3CE|nr:hypothetical protein VC55_gp37 [Vibrio phage VpKK5]AIM40622.1 hypothetical protein [Vibrio phage VpKK5]
MVGVTMKRVRATKRGIQLWVDAASYTTRAFYIRVKDNFIEVGRCDRNACYNPKTIKTMQAKARRLL